MDGMSLKILYDNLEKNFMNKFSEKLNENVKLSNYSWFNLGGNADYLFKPKNKNDLKEFFKAAKNKFKNNYC